MAAGSVGARLIELPDGVLGTVVPVRPWFSIFNSVLYREADSLERALPALAEAYAKCGVHAWTVWVPPGDQRAAAVLEQAGHRLDSTPQLMAANLADLDLRPCLELELESDPGWEAVARCNDRAHGVLEDWTMSAVFSQMRDPASRLCAARLDGELASVLIAREHDGDCYLWFVATTPEARGRGLAAELVRTALRDAAARGCQTTTLESTRMAERLYARLGYRPLGRYGMWERRD